MDSCQHAVKKPANWLNFVKLRPRRHADLIRYMIDLRTTTPADELLKSASKFVALKYPEVGDHSTDRFQ
ncbi:unnamed protein product [Protopolystoma xenopodis]|uniref:Uncharacterized protein n=1 Tax=Protopolystoma xenopodis TaxID=117903 RepID=A0A3S5A5G8_9PLAT|nr:unnamed protein product [Protopolystoma xenopodis]